MELKAAIVEDETEESQRLREALERFCMETETTLSVTLFESAERFLFHYQPVFDVIFMDIRMPGTDGMSAAESLRKMDLTVPLVFVTSMVQYAVKGYDVGALDFIVKPVKYPAFRMKMRRILSSVRMNKSPALLLNIGGEIQVIPIGEIVCLEVQDHELTYHTSTRDYTLRGRLSAAIDKLPAEQFFQVSASAAVNFRYVERISGEDVKVGGRMIRISRARKKAFLEALSVFMGSGMIR